MGTKDFNILDAFIAHCRLGRITQHIASGDRILDFGCGHQARLLTTLRERIKSGIGLDYDIEDSDPWPNIQLRRSRFTGRLDLPNAQFDKIVMLAVLEHIPLDLVGPLFVEFSRVLKPDGRILLTTPTPRGKPVLEFLAFKLRIISAPEIADHKHYYTRNDIESLAEKTGLAVETYRTFQLGMNCIASLRQQPRTVSPIRS